MKPEEALARAMHPQRDTRPRDWGPWVWDQMLPDWQQGAVRRAADILNELDRLGFALVAKTEEVRVSDAVSNEPGFSEAYEDLMALHAAYDESGGAAAAWERLQARKRELLAMSGEAAAAVERYDERIEEAAAARGTGDGPRTASAQRRRRGR